jgi:glyoxylase-like metal-dependent hydrolase (beta-lactamase superfamily II)
MKTTEGIAMLNLPAMMSDGTIHPTVVWDSQNVVLIDAGFPGQLPQLKEELERLGLPMDKIIAVIITHQDIDHIGSLRSLLDASPHPLEVISHAEEKPYIQGDLPPVKLTQLEDRLDSLQGPEGEQMKSIYQKMKSAYPNLITKVTRTVADGEILPWCGGLQIIWTPGHTPGHISVYHAPTKTLITGDAMILDESGLKPAMDRATLDNKLVAASLKKFASLDVQSVICYHGGLCASLANEQIAKIIGQD